MRVQIQTETKSPLKSIPVSSRFATGATLKPTAAILIYNEAVGDSSLATIHGIMQDSKGQNEITPGQLLTNETFVRLMESVKTEVRQERQVLPGHVLWRDAGMLVWYRPAIRRPIYFATSDPKFNRALNGKEVAHPALLFKAVSGSLSIYALPSDERPANETKLFFAPYFNLYNHGGMCRGNSPYPKTLNISTIDAWEKAFFDTLFTHSNYQKKYFSHPKGHDGMWREMLNAEQFDSSALLENGLTVGKILDEKSTSN